MDSASRRPRLPGVAASVRGFTPRGRHAKARAMWSLRRSRVLLLTAFGLIFVSITAYGTASGDMLVSGTSQVLKLTDATAPGGARPVWVYRPDVPDSASLPVVYFLHGLPGNASDLEKNGVATELDQMIHAGLTAPFVLAVPDGATVGVVDPEWANSPDGRVRLESFITGPLIDAVEGNHRRDTADRAIAGFSMGGYGATNIAAHHPDLYSQVASIDGYFHIDDPSGVYGNATAADTANSPDHNLSAFKGLHIMLADSNSDYDDVTHGETARFAALLHAAGIAATVTFVPGAHDWGVVRTLLPSLTSFLRQGWSNSA